MPKKISPGLLRLLPRAQPAQRSEEPSTRVTPKGRGGRLWCVASDDACRLARDEVGGLEGLADPDTLRRALAQGRQLRPGDPGERRPPEPRRHCASYVGRTGELERAGP